MILELNSRYHLSFSADFSDLDGIYQIIGIFSYGQVLDQEIDLYAQLYELVGKSETDLVAQLSTYQSDTFYQCKEANGTGTICAPMSIITDANASVKKYFGTMLAVNLGSFDDPEIVYPITDVVLNTLRDRLGNPDPEDVIENAEALSELGDFHASLQIFNQEWMLISEYENIVKRRKASREKAEALGGKDHDNYITKYLNAIEQISQLNEQKAILEAKVIELMELLQP